MYILINQNRRKITWVSNDESCKSNLIILYPIQNTIAKISTSKAELLASSLLDLNFETNTKEYCKTGC